MLRIIISENKYGCRLQLWKSKKHTRVIIFSPDLVLNTDVVFYTSFAFQNIFYEDEYICISLIYFRTFLTSPIDYLNQWEYILIDIAFCSLCAVIKKTLGGISGVAVGYDTSNQGINIKNDTCRVHSTCDNSYCGLQHFSYLFYYFWQTNGLVILQKTRDYLLGSIYS